MTVFIPAKVRGIVYTLYAIIGVAIGGMQVGYSAAEATQPTWLKVALAVYAFVGGAIGYTAASNTPAAPSEAAAPEAVQPPDAADETYPAIPDPADAG